MWKTVNCPNPILVGELVTGRKYIFKSDRYWPGCRRLIVFRGRHSLSPEHIFVDVLDCDPAAIGAGGRRTNQLFHVGSFEFFDLSHETSLRRVGIASLSMLAFCQLSTVDLAKIDIGKNIETIQLKYDGYPDTFV
jgi:hypothetical protein